MLSGLPTEEALPGLALHPGYVGEEAGAPGVVEQRVGARDAFELRGDGGRVQRLAVALDAHRRGLRRQKHALVGSGPHEGAREVRDRLVALSGMVAPLEDAALQAPDQEKITTDELEGLRQQYELDQEEKKLKELEKASKKKRKRKN